jgi:hypothetical protein
MATTAAAIFAMTTADCPSVRLTVNLPNAQPVHLPLASFAVLLYLNGAGRHVPSCPGKLLISHVRHISA